VHRLLGEEAQHGGADVAARRAAPATPAATMADRAALGLVRSVSMGVVVALAGMPAFASWVREHASS
jgi:hypothetical protein